MQAMGLPLLHYHLATFAFDSLVCMALAVLMLAAGAGAGIRFWGETRWGWSMLLALSVYAHGLNA